jgi:hypothetical protein
MSVADRWHLVLWLQKWLQIQEMRELGRLELEVRKGMISRVEFEDL